MDRHPAQSLKPRKMPSQTRAENTVTVIVEAAAQVLAKNRYEKTTTNHIAERAGVSVGTIRARYPILFRQSRCAAAIMYERQRAGVACR